MKSNFLNLPIVIGSEDVAGAVYVLRNYFGARYPRADLGSLGSTEYTGAWFDEFDPSGFRRHCANEITSDDLVSLALLSTPINGPSVLPLLETHREQISTLLAELPVDTPLWELKDSIDETWAASHLETLFDSMPGIGPTRASKLIARKRPHLYPICDSVVIKVLGTNKAHVHRISMTFQERALRSFLYDVRAEAGLPNAVSLLRVFDVLAWMQGTSELSK